MMGVKVTFTILFLQFCISSLAQSDRHSSWSFLSGYEANYFGNNINLLLRRQLTERHIVDAGFSYNISDGFSDNPVIGLDLDYRYRAVIQNNWNAALGVSYRRQKPLDIVNIQAINFTQSIQYSISKSFSVQSTLGYGVAVERSASARQFSQFNSVSGLLSVQCVYHLF